MKTEGDAIAILHFENQQMRKLLQDINRHMQAEWDARRLPASCWPASFIRRIDELLS